MNRLIKIVLLVHYICSHAEILSTNKDDKTVVQVELFIVFRNKDYKNLKECRKGIEENIKNILSRNTLTLYKFNKKSEQIKYLFFT